MAQRGDDMTINPDNLINSVLESLSRIDFVHPEEIPSIPLYMDQVTSLMDKEMSAMKRYPEDKILTKTMINNYAKNNLLPPPVKKKYEREHVMMLIFIYYFKNLLSIKDIETLLTPITERHFGPDKNINMFDIYSEVLNMQKDCIDDLKGDIQVAFEKAQATFAGYEDPDIEYFKTLAFICNLCVDAFVKKQLVEELIDHMSGLK